MIVLDKCPNAVNCQVLHKEGFVANEEDKEFYRQQFCRIETEEGYFKCKRFITKKELGFCPDFVLPDSEMTIDEIIIKIEE